MWITDSSKHDSHTPVLCSNIAYWAHPDVGSCMSKTPMMTLAIVVATPRESARLFNITALL